MRGLILTATVLALAVVSWFALTVPDDSGSSQVRRSVGVTQSHILRARGERERQQ